MWNHTVGGEVVSSPAIADGLVYVGSYDGKVYALNSMTGGYIWSYATGGMVVSSPAISNHVVYVGSYDHMSTRLDLNCKASSLSIVSLE